MIVSNLSKEDKRGTETIHTRRLGVTGKKLINGPDEQSLPAAGNKLTLEMPGWGIG